MKLKSAALLAAGLVAGILLAPKKGSETQKILKEKIDEIYLQVKELDIESIQDKLEEIKIDISKMDVQSSKEFVSKQASVVKEKLNNIVDELQNNKEIQPKLRNVIDKTESAINDTIDYIDENDLINKASGKAKGVIEKTKEIGGDLKEKSVEWFDDTESAIHDTIDHVNENDLINKASSKAKEVLEKTEETAEDIKEKSAELLDKTSEKAEKVVDKVKSKVKKD